MSLLTKQRLSFPMRLFGTLLCIIVYRLLSAIPLPYLKSDVLSGVLAADNGVNILSVLTGGALGRMSVAALGISPIISASILIQVVGIVIPRLQEAQRDGIVGQRYIQDVTLVVSVILAFCMAYPLAHQYQMLGFLTDNRMIIVALLCILMVCSSFVLSMIARLIDTYLFGNGVSVLLLVGVVSTIPSNLYRTIQQVSAWSMFDIPWLPTVLLFVSLMGIWMFVCWMLSCKMEIPLMYSRKLVNAEDKMNSVLPLQMLMNSILPVIFASMILSAPSFVSNLVGHEVRWLRIFDTNAWFNINDLLPSVLGIPIYVALIFLFSRYSQLIWLNEREIAENLRKANFVIEGVNPGVSTEMFLHEKIQRLNKYGSICLVIISFLPVVAGSIFGLPFLHIVGTSLVLIVAIIKELVYEFRVSCKGLQYTRMLHRLRFGRKQSDKLCLLQKTLKG